MGEVGKMLDQLALLKELHCRSQELMQSNQILTESINGKRLKATGVHLVRQRHLTTTLANEQLKSEYHGQCLRDLRQAIDYESGNCAVFKQQIVNCRRSIQKAKENSISRDNIQRNLAVDWPKESHWQHEQALLKDTYVEKAIARRQQQNRLLEASLKEQQSRIRGMSERIRLLLQPPPSLHATEKTALKLKSLDMSID